MIVHCGRKDKCSLRTPHSIKHRYFTTKSFLIFILFTCSSVHPVSYNICMERKKNPKASWMLFDNFPEEKVTHRIPTVPKMYSFNLQWQIWDRQETGME